MIEQPGSAGAMESTPDGAPVVRGPNYFVFATALTYSTQLIVATLSLGNVLIVSWTLGAGGRGNVALLTTVAYLTASASTLGIEQANANVGARDPSKRATLATNSLWMATLVGVIAASLVALLITLVPSAGGGVGWDLRLLALASVPIVLCQICLDQLVRAEYGYLWANAGWLTQPLINVGLNGIMAITGELTVGRAVGTWVTGQVVSLLVLLWYLVAKGSGFGRPDRGLAVRSVKFGLRAYAGRVLNVGNYRLDQWILGAVAGARPLGLYSVAVSWAEVLFFLPTVISLVQRPILVQLSGLPARDSAARVFRVATLLTIPFMLGLIVLAPFLCTTVFPSSFAGSIAELRVLAFGAFGIVALKLLGNALTARDEPLLATIATAFSFGATVILDFSLIPLYGWMGASIASTVSYTLGGVAIAYYFKRALGGTLSDLIPSFQDMVDVSRLPRRVTSR